MKRLTLILVVLASLAATAAYALPNFVNGGFEANSFTGWTLSGQNYITSAGYDPRAGGTNLSLVYTGDHAAKVGDQFSWGWAGNYNGTPPPVNSEFSSISQRETVGPADLQDLYFAWAAVALQPGAGHANDETPYFKIEVNQYHLGAKTVLFSEEEFTGPLGATNPGWVMGVADNDNLGGNYHDGSTWYYVRGTCST